MTFLACFLALVFTSLAALHAYWACGGTWAASVALPKHPDGKVVFLPGKIACLAVTLGLSAFAYVCLAHVQLLPPCFLMGRTKLVLLVLSGLFALRMIGDFKFAGLFRRVHPTDFSRMDRLFYTPLCLVLSGLLALLALLPTSLS